MIEDRLIFLKKLQPDFVIAGLNEKTGKPSEWFPVTINPNPKTISFRQQLDNEFILELDLPSVEKNTALYNEKIKPALIRAGFVFECWTTQSKSLHVHLFFRKPLTNEQRKQIVDCLFEEDAVKALDNSFWTKSRQLVALEHALHYKSGKPKTLIETLGEGLNVFSETKLLLLKKEATEAERCRVVMSLKEFNGWNEEEIFNEISKHNAWEDYDPKITKEKIAVLFKHYAGKPNPNRPEQEEKSPLEFEPFKQAISGRVNWLQFACSFVKTAGIYFDNTRNWWFWDKKKSCWILVDETDVLNLVDEALQNQPQTTQANLKTQIVEALKRQGRKNKPLEPRDSWLQFKKKIIDVETGETFTSTPEYFFTNPIMWDLGDGTDTPTMDRLFKEWVGEKNAETLFEIIAFTLSPLYFIHVIVCLTGGGSNGKSTFLKIISKFLGTHNITSTDLDTLINSRFETAKLYKKLVCTMGETNFTTLSKTSLLKRLVGEDLIGGEFKNKSPFDFYNFAKVLIATNTLPVSEDRTRGFYRRWLLIDFPNEFPPDRDVFSEIPDTEFSNLARKSVALLKKLRQQRRFTYEPSIEEKIQQYEDRSNPVNKFLTENFVRDFDGKVPFFAFYEDYMVYLSQRRFRKQSKKEVSALLEAEGFEIKRASAKKEDGSETTWFYVFGLRYRQGLEKYEDKQIGEERK